MSRFVPAGTDPESLPPTEDDAWVKAKQQVEFLRKPKPVNEGNQEDGKSLYEVLEANKAAKQEAFEESIRLKNQFRALDDDEVDFLDSVLESSRAKEDAVKKETAEQLEAFRKQRAEAEKEHIDQGSPSNAESLGAPVVKNEWSTQKKRRRRDKDHEPASDNKLRRLSSSVGDKSMAAEATKSNNAEKADSSQVAKPTPKHQIKTASSTVAPTTTTNAVGLGLGDYSSDED